MSSCPCAAAAPARAVVTARPEARGDLDPPMGSKPATVTAPCAKGSPSHRRRRARGRERGGRRPRNRPRERGRRKRRCPGRRCAGERRRHPARRVRPGRGRRRHPRDGGGAGAARAAPRRAPLRARVRAADRLPPDRPLQRRRPRRHLLRAGLAEGAALRRRRPRALRVLRSEGDPLRALRQAGPRGRRERARPPRRARTAGARERGPGLRRLGAGEIAEIEPNARGAAALHSPNTGVVDFVAVAESYAEDVRRAGGSTHMGAAVGAVEATPDGLVLRHARGTTKTAAAVFCAGLWSDRLAVACGAPADPRIVPFRGGYLKLPAEAAKLIRANVYPVPEPDLPFLGAHLTRTLAGDVLIGPSALIAPARDAYELHRARGPRPARNRRLAGDLEARRHPPPGRRPGDVHALSRRSFVNAAAKLVPALRGVRAETGAGRDPRPGAGPRRQADRRLRRPPHRARRPRPQRALPRRHLLAGAGAADRRRTRLEAERPRRGWGRG